MILVATSDWHLDQSTAGVDRYPDQCAAIDVSVEAAIEMKADAYLMNGDLTDPNTVQCHRAVAKATEVHTRLTLAGVVPIWVPGNHDVIEDGSGMSTMESLKHCGIANRVLSAPGCYPFRNSSGKELASIIALPFTPSSHPYDPDALIRWVAQESEMIKPGLPVIVPGHLNLEGISPGSETTHMARGRDVYWPIEALQEHFPNAILIGGHYHTPQVYKGVNIIGSLARLRFDERDNTPGYMVLEL